MIPGLGGRLLSSDALDRVVRRDLAGQLGEASAAPARRRLRPVLGRLRTSLGPASSARAIMDDVAAPLVRELGYGVRPVDSGGPDHVCALLSSGARPVAALVVLPWDGVAAWRDAVRPAVGLGVRWCLCLAGPSLRIVDAGRAHARRHASIDLDTARDDARTFAVLWGLVRAEALDAAGTGATPMLERAIDLSERHRAMVRASLQDGVHVALDRFGTAFLRALSRGRPRRQHVNGGVHEEALILVYRVLFLLFAEARGLVPSWHDVYRRSYTIEALRPDVERSTAPAGLWESLQAIARLAHRGCHAGTLRVEPFNGPLFAPSRAPLADTLVLDDGDVRAAVLALTTRQSPGGFDRIAYGDLGVEQLGGVYEGLLDDEAAGGKQGRRRETGAFYTPRAVTELVVRRTLAPLVAGASPERILALRIVDPAMGSGAFLVAACRYLAAAYEAALVAHGARSAYDITDAERAGFRRLVAQRCLYGVDRNPMAVHLGRLSLWLATLAADKPLTFLDHHLRTGDTLVGASPAEVLRRPPPGDRTTRQPADLPLFRDVPLDDAVGSAGAIRIALSEEPGDTIDQVRAKERALADLDVPASIVGRWKAAAGLWCAAWFVAAPEQRAFRKVLPALLSDALTGRSPLPDHVLAPYRAAGRTVADDVRCFHWALEFPEVFHDRTGRPDADGGFDAVLGNPPWEMLRDDSPGAGSRDGRTRAGVAAFARTSGLYRWQGDGHTNLYQLFVERSLSLLRRGGRLGLVLPSGFATDHGSTRLRRHVFDNCPPDTFTIVDNRAGIFPIHRSLKFVLMTGTSGAPPRTLPVRAGISAVAELESLADRGDDPAAVGLSREFLRACSGDALAVPFVRCQTDRHIAAAIVAAAPPLGSADGWHVRFGRELNVTDDRPHFVVRRATGGLPRGSVPVIEGKHLSSFTVTPSSSRYGMPLALARQRVPAAFHPRVAYRDVSSPTNRTTLIAAVVPAGVLTTHTVFCARAGHGEDVQHYLCGLLNSFVLDFVARLRVGTHVTTAIAEGLPAPVLPADSPRFRAIVALSRRLAVTPADPAAAASLQAAVARLFGLDRAGLAHVLETFPLVERGHRDDVLSAFGI